MAFSCTDLQNVDPVYGCDYGFCFDRKRYTAGFFSFQLLSSAPSIELFCSFHSLSHILVKIFFPFFSAEDPWTHFVYDHVDFVRFPVYTLLCLGER
jgi:hypothetical protein